MAIAQIVNVIVRLMGKHGLLRGAKLAKDIGFKNKHIKKAVKVQRDRMTVMEKAYRKEQKTIAKHRKDSRDGILEDPGMDQF